ncbi:unnamed protein product [Arctia plantaginis]|uniref:START domain-containing protein n=1 Tax=Arctia plantaginis TaxID=874455 RepID=A0A8S1BNA8_ARCPL|nr:unnamed protein product [Arctia plantaginis]
MSPIRIIIKDLRMWSIWTRSSIVSNVIRKCSRDRGVREVIQCFRHAFLRPKRTLLISATAAYKARDDEDENTPCENSITDAELQELLKDMDAVEMLSRRTLFCENCGMRLVIDKKQPGVRYCSCTTSQVSEKPTDMSDGWVPYMEAEDVIIWRKEYKPGLGLYAYKVYGRYSEVRAADFAAIQVDGAYRRVWDAAVAALTVVERSANGLSDQAVLHWEVLWPRLFANRDYVYIRRHKEFDVVGKSLRHREGLFQAEVTTDGPCTQIFTERPSVHSNAKRKATEINAKEKEDSACENKVYVILNRSCEHPDVPETKHAIRVSEYWSHMVVKTMNGPNKNGMEFVLTYYDEPAVGGMPSSVASWATGRAAPAYLQRMRRAATEYRAWRDTTQQDIPDFTPFGPQDKKISDEKELVPLQIDKEVVTISVDPGLESSCKEDESVSDPVTEGKKHTITDDETEFGLESIPYNSEMEVKETKTRDQGTQTEQVDDGQKENDNRRKEDKSVSTDREVRHDPVQTDGEPLKVVEEEEPKNGKAEKS